MPKNAVFPLLPLSLFLLFFAFACQQDRRAEKMPDSVTAYVYGYTAGIISKTSDIRVRFASTAVEEHEVGQSAPSNILTFSPAIAGESTWEDQQTLRFTPAEALPSGRAYIATVRLAAVYDGLPDEAHAFEFDFRVRDQFLTLDIEGLHAPNPRALEEQHIRGSLRTADLADAEAIQQTLSASQDGRELPIEWEHDASTQQHYFTIKEVARGDQASEVSLSWDGEPIGFAQNGKQAIEVPALGDFKLLSATPMQGKDQYLRLQFSDPLDEEQDFSGLVSLQNYEGTLRYLADGNSLRLYPSGRLSGEYQVVASPGLRNITGQRMKKASTWTVQVDRTKPQVRLVGKGVVMPTSDGLIFPFEAVSLNAVEVEVFKIYHNNILQFLQTNQLDGDYDLNRVGRPILQTKVPLSYLNEQANPAEWTRYALDLKELIETDPEALYQVRIGFRPGYANFFCPDSDVSADIEPLKSPADDGQEIESIMDNWYGFSGYYEGYSYRQRQDPCYPAYYNAERFVQRNVIASNLGIIAKGSDGQQFFVAIADLRTAQPVEGAEVTFYDYQQQPIHTVTTDGDGIARTQLTRTPFVAIATQGEEQGYLRLQDGDALSLSRFDVAGVQPQKGLKGFLYGERGVWRPGDSVYLNFMLEDERGTLPPNYPVRFELRDPRGQLQQQHAVSRQVNKLYPLHFATSTDAPTGIWRATVRAGGAVFTKNLRIETVKPNRLKAQLDFGASSLSVADEPIRATLTANWLHGAPANGLKVKVEAQLKASKTTFAGYPAHTFDDPARPFDPQSVTAFEGQLNNEGQREFNFRLSNQQQLPGKLTANFKTRVFERGGDFSTSYASVPYDPYIAYTGVLLPEDEQGQPRATVGATTPLSFVSLASNGRPLSDRELNVGIYRVEWRWWWDRSSDNVSRYNSSEHYDALATQRLTTNSKGEARWDYEVAEWGRYLVRVCDAETGHCAGELFYAGYPWYGEDGNDAYRKAAAMLSFSSDKERYNVGDEVQLQLPEGKSGQALITIENGEKVLSSFWATAKEGENIFKFKATEEMAPNVYAHVAMLQPHAQADNDLPIRMYGVIPIQVEDAGTHLQPRIRMADELKPKASFAVNVSEQDGRPMTYTLAVVDEGLLDLTSFQTPEPWKQFFARQALGVRTWDMYDHVLGAYGGELERLLSIGGDAAMPKAAKDAQANRFEPVVMHLGPFHLGKGQKAKHELTMPNYVGSVRVMVVAGERGAYGQAEKTVPVKQPLMVLATLPRVLSPGERLDLPINVFAMDDKIKKVAVEVKETSGLVKVNNLRRPSLSFAKPGDQMMNVPLQVGEATGVARFTITVKGNGETASQEVEIQVRNPNPYATEVTSEVLDPGESYEFNFLPPGMAGTNEAVLELSTIPPINLGERLNYLIRYPYGCLEQTLSGGFPQLYVNQLLELDAEQKEQVPKNIMATIERLKQFQTQQGGFAYWPGQSRPNPWSTSYAGHFLLEAKALGHPVPASLIQKWIQYQQQAAKVWDPKADELGFYYANNKELMQAYRLFTLALAEKPDLAAMNRLREYRGLSKQGKWRLAAAYALVGKPEVAQRLTNGLSTEVSQYREMSYTYGSRLRDRAMFLETLTLIGERERAASLVQYISDEMSSQRWLSTQETSFALLAIGKFVGQSDTKAPLDCSYLIGAGKSASAESDLPMLQVAVPVKAGQHQTVRVENTGNGTVFARVIRTGQPLSGAEQAASNHIAISLLFVDMDGRGLDAANLPQGQDFLAVASVTHRGSRPMPFAELALSQVFPSGWEIINTRLDNVSDPSKGSNMTYQDIRDDRVNTFFDLAEGKTATYRVQLNAAYQGRYYLPATSCEAMYDNSVSALVPGQWVEVGAAAVAR